MRQLFIILLSFAGTSLMAQTKDIAFESHSGDKANFEVTVNNDLFDVDNSDFGLPAPKEIKTYKLDSVIYVSDKVAVVITKEYRRPSDKPKDSAKFWNKNRDTVYNDPLFTRKHSLDSIRKVLQTNGYYVNPVRKAVFIGYDNKRVKTDKQNMVPVAFTGDNNNKPPFDPLVLMMLGIILLLSLLGGWLSWKFFQPRFQ